MRFLIGSSRPLHRRARGPRTQVRAGAGIIDRRASAQRPAYPGTRGGRDQRPQGVGPEARVPRYARGARSATTGSRPRGPRTQVRAGGAISDHRASAQRPAYPGTRGGRDQRPQGVGPEARVPRYSRGRESSTVGRRPRGPRTPTLAGGAISDHRASAQRPAYPDTRGGHDQRPWGVGPEARVPRYARERESSTVGHRPSGPRTLTRAGAGISDRRASAQRPAYPGTCGGGNHRL